MPDWQRQHLSGLARDPAEKEEVQAELAAHLEEACEAFCQEGLPEKQAIHRTMEKVSDWRVLQRKISLAKRREGLLQKRVRQLWLPGSPTLILSTVFLVTLQKLGFPPRIVESGPGAVLFYLPWLASLPFFGALGAYLSALAGASRATALLVSVFPVLALTTAFLLMFPIGMIIERVTGNQVDFSIVATALLSEGIGWLLVPGIALLAGGRLAHLWFGRRSSSEGAAIG